MNPEFLPYLCCPHTREALTIHVSEYYPNQTIKTGFLETSTGEHRYPILGGIPRFVSKELYSDSFGYEWSKWPRIQFESVNTNKPMEGHTKKMFQLITGWNESDIRGRTVIEFGCGPGRFIEIIRSWGGIAVGIDMSSAVETARKNFEHDSNVLIIQGDILNPPIRMEAFDYGYSIGVMHHTPDPARGIQKLADSVGRGGKIACCVYSKKGFYNYPSVHVYRNILKFISIIFNQKIKNRLAMRYAAFSSQVLYPSISAIRKIPVIGIILSYIIGKYFFVVLLLPDEDWRMLDTFDAITPYYASTHTPEELIRWLKPYCTDIKRTEWGDTSITGIKTASMKQ